MDIPFNKRDRSVNSFGPFSVLNILIIIGTELISCIAVYKTFLVIYFIRIAKIQKGRL